MPKHAHKRGAPPPPRANRNSSLAVVSGNRLGVTVRALLVGRAIEELGRLKQAFRVLGIEPHVLKPDRADLFDVLERDPRISVLAVRLADLGRSQEDAFLRTIYDSPGLQVAAIGAGRDLKAKLRRLGVTGIYDATSPPAHIAEAAAAALDNHDFDALILSTLKSTLQVALAETTLDAKPLTPLLRVGAGVLGPLSAMIELRGDLAGRLIVAGQPSFFERVSKSWIGTSPSTRDAIWDVAGELANRVAGLVRNHYNERGIESTQTAPTIVEGSSVSIRCLSNKPGLVVPFEVRRSSDTVYVELIIVSKAADGTGDQTSMASGELSFF